MTRGPLRGLPWATLLSMTAAGGALLGAAAGSPDSSLSHHLVGLAFAVIAAAAAYVLDEPAAAVVDATPVSLRARTLVRTSALGIPLAVNALALAVMGARDNSLPIWWLGLPLLGVTALALTAAAALRRRQPRPGEGVASTFVVLIVAVGLYDPFARWFALLPITSNEHWGRTGAAWGLLIAASALVLARATRDPLDA